MILSKKVFYFTLSNQIWVQDVNLINRLRNQTNQTPALQEGSDYINPCDKTIFGPQMSVPEENIGSGLGFMTAENEMEQTAYFNAQDSTTKETIYLSANGSL